VCKSAPIPGETKIWQYIALTRSIFLIDCPGIVYDREGNSDINAVLKGVVRVERLGAADKTDVVQAVLDTVKRRDIEGTYGISEWSDANSFLDKLALARGKLLPGGVPDADIVARSVLYDWQRGKIPWFVPPPFDSERAKDNTQTLEDAKLLSNIEKMNTLNVVDDQIVNELGEDGEDDEGEEEVGDRRRPRENDDDEEQGEGQQQQHPINSAAEAGRKNKHNTLRQLHQLNAGGGGKRGAAGFSTVVSAAAAAEQSAKKQQQKEKRNEKMKNTTFATADDVKKNSKNNNSSSTEKATATKKNNDNQDLWDAFVAASK